ncbi:MerR family transcriptional regulator [Nocardioidaceae bacterium]|nr:MerR family transcriptional regulator [Nocardioidaceae bacterium]
MAGRAGQGGRGRAPSAPGPDVPVYVISVAAELTGLHPQTLRTYDRIGLVSPGRTGGGGRRYSLRDLEVLREVAELTAAGIGLEGVKRILDLENQVLALRSRNTELRRRLAEVETELVDAADVVTRLAGELRASEEESTSRLPVLRTRTVLTRYQGPFPEL